MRLLSLRTDRLWSEQETLGFRVRIPWGTSHLHRKAIQRVWNITWSIASRGFLIQRKSLSIRDYPFYRASAHLFLQNIYHSFGRLYSPPSETWALTSEKAVQFLCCCSRTSDRPYFCFEPYFFNKKKRLPLSCKSAFSWGAKVAGGIWDHQIGGRFIIYCSRTKSVPSAVAEIPGFYNKNCYSLLHASRFYCIVSSWANKGNAFILSCIFYAYCPSSNFIEFIIIF